MYLDVTLEMEGSVVLRKEHSVLRVQRPGSQSWLCMSWVVVVDNLWGVCRAHCHIPLSVPLLPVLVVFGSYFYII